MYMYQSCLEQEWRREQREAGAQQLKNDLHMISNEARKKHPAVREVSLTRLGLGGKLVQLTLPILSPNLLSRLYVIITPW